MCSSRRQIGLITLTKREPTLEDVFVDLVGRSMEEVEHVDRDRPSSIVHRRSSIVDASGWRLFARTVAARAYPRLIMNVREKWWMVFDIVLPLIGLCAYVFIYRANNAPADLIGFVILGGAMSAYWMNVLWSMGNQLFWEKETGNLALYIMAPNSMMAILLGMALGGMVTTTRAGGRASSRSAACCSMCTSRWRTFRCWWRCSSCRSSRSTGWG